jgi:ATP-dependent RNA helicase RhlE
MATFYRTPWKASESSGSEGASRPSRGGSSYAPRSNSTGPRSSSPAGGRPTYSRSSGGGSGYQGSRPGYQGSNDRPRFGGGRPSFGGGNRGGGNGGGRSRGPMGEHIDVARFINKAVITEEVVNFVPVHQFADFDISDKIKQNLEAKGYVLPTPIQDKAIPHVLNGEDVVGLANTGTGKTAAFLIPLIHRVAENRNARVLIMAPTRELAVQITDELKAFSRAMSIHHAICVGGAGIYPQVSALRHNPSFVIGTPGRLKDLMERGALNVNDYSTVVLDEADRMLDMGFIADMRFIMGQMPKPRHTLFFSATLSREIENLIGEFLNNPVRISVKTGDTAKTVDQDVVRVGQGKQKFDVLVDMLKVDPTMSKVLVFGRTKHGVERIATDLMRAGVRSEAIHGNKTHGRRLKALELFKADKVQVLVATDVAARGLDISGVSHVINYDLPSTYADYVHRIGRTGRAGKTGKALTFI